MTSTKASFLKIGAYAFLSFIFGLDANLTAQSPCKPNIIGSWEEEQDALSAMFAEKKVYKFYEGGKVEIYQGNSLLGNGKYKIDIQTNPTKIIFSNLSVLIFQTEGEFAFPIVKCNDSVLEWVGTFGIHATIHKICVPSNEKISFKVSNVPVIKQEFKQTCWAASAAMMYSWKKGKRFTAEETLTLNDAIFLKYYYEQKGDEWGLPNAFCITYFQFFERDMGLTLFEPNEGNGPIPSVCEISELLKNNGPILLCSYSHFPQYNNNEGHVKLIVGIQSDGTEEGTILSIIDPWAFDGSKQTYTEIYQEFTQMSEITLNSISPCLYKIYFW